MEFSIVFGGASFEHEISIVSAISLLKKGLSIKQCIFLDGSHRFYLIDKKDMKSTYFSNGKYKDAKELFLGVEGFYTKGMLGKVVPLETNIVINLIHGKDGEDGTLSALFDFYKIRYIGPRAEASMLSFDKSLTKLYAATCDVKTLRYEIVSREDRVVTLKPPFIIKPLRLGSSLGVSVVRDIKELDYALDVAFEFDNKVIVEPFVENVKEFNLAGFLAKEGMVHSVVEEPVKKEFLDFENKYLDFSRTTEVSKAVLSESLESRLKLNFDKLYGDIFAGALIRCDFFVIDDEVYINEINPVPGSLANYLFTDINASLNALALNLPKNELIKVSYKYIDKIHKAKGKA
ncbi:D-alanine--D-alanine ligase A [Helicobacter sp. 13S00401-1]|uniref:D-alanine--D-alanine ligase n=1 Tax=Helicobacter sp. 13S00401-1 TaxID=1905758 RepID=UPI000BA5AB08|nr:D-alanine--D-alanine ligase [Helicobacter sp. 13S00401-1]PAF51354.1 D-alanine--D-alanine ligase A [Helicobacter sp. 13S00401-1]